MSIKVFEELDFLAGATIVTYTFVDNKLTLFLESGEIATFILDRSHYYNFRKE